MLRFVSHSTSHRDVHEIRGAHLLGADSVPVPGEIQADAGGIACEPRHEDPTALSLLWNIPEYGTVQLETTRLPQRATPYCLSLELARHRLMRINLKREEWGLFDYPGMDSFSPKIEEARRLFVKALQNADSSDRADELAHRALACSMNAADQMCSFHSNVFLQRRHSTGGFNKHFLGIAIPERPVSGEMIGRIKNGFDFVRLPLPWRDVQPKENTYRYEHADAWMAAAKKANLPVVGGPLLNFGVRFVPDWMYIWENDFETIFEYAQEHIRRTVKRMGDKVGTWIIASGLHADNALAFSFEQIMELTRMAASVVRSAAPRAKLLLDLVQPWGEYYARNQQTIPPLLYADMVVQSGINFDGFGLQLLFGLQSDGFHFRDQLQISALIDRLANLGKPIHITALGAPSSGGADMAGAPGQEWQPETQGTWLENTIKMALSKPYVESVCLRDLIDSPDAAVPFGGLIDANGTPKPALAALGALRTKLQNPPEK